MNGLPRATANGHARFGSRATRLASKLGQRIDVKRLTELLGEAEAIKHEPCRGGSFQADFIG